MFVLHEKHTGFRQFASTLTNFTLYLNSQGVQFLGNFGISYFFIYFSNRTEMITEQRDKQNFWNNFYYISNFSE